MNVVNKHPVHTKKLVAMRLTIHVLLRGQI